jgi:hypothetical protein
MDPNFVLIHRFNLKALPNLMFFHIGKSVVRHKLWHVGTILNFSGRSYRFKLTFNNEKFLAIHKVYLNRAKENCGGPHLFNLMFFIDLT